jgi:glutaconate CoA-transferase subunit A
MSTAIAEFVPDGASVALGVQLEQMIPFAAGHEIIRQRRRDLTLIGPISDILFDQMIGAGCVRRVIAAWVGNVMMGSAYNFRRAVEKAQAGVPVPHNQAQAGAPTTDQQSPGAPCRCGDKGAAPQSGVSLPHAIEVINMTNFTIALALQAGAMGVPFSPTRTALGSDVSRENPMFAEMTSPFTNERLHAVRALVPDVAIVHVQRADRDGNAHCWGNFGVMIEAVRASKRVIVVAEEIVEPEVIASDPNRTVIPGFLVSAVVECPMGAHPSPVQGYYKRDNEFYRQYHAETKTIESNEQWLRHWVYDVPDRAEYINRLGLERADSLKAKQHAYAAPADFGY